MVSTAMQGGCTCENACLLRVGTGNVEFAGLFAPKPLAMTAADDWTKEMATKGFPELQQLYQLLEAPDRVALYAYTQFPHNYNAVSRAAMYEWVNRHFQLGLPTPIVEQDYPRLTAEQLTVWDAQHPQPPGGDDFERDLLRRWQADTQRQLDAVVPQDEARWQAFRQLVGGGLDVIIGRSLPAAGEVEFQSVAEADQGSFVLVTGLLRNKPHREELPVVLLKPKQPTGRRVIWLHADGKSGLLTGAGAPRPLLNRLLEAGVEVLGVDLIYQGEFLAEGQRLEQTRRVKNPRESAAYTFGYNHAVFAQRVHDVLTVIAFARGQEPQPRRVSLVGLGPAGPWAAAALAPAGAALDAAAIDTAGFRFGAVRDLHSPEFLPGGARYFDLPGMLALAAGRPLWLAGETADSAELVAQAYRAAGQEAKLQRFEGPGEEIPQAVVRWLTAAAPAGP